MHAPDHDPVQRGEWSLIAYVELCLRRHAAAWRSRLSRRAGFELMLLNEPVGGEGVEYGELLSGAFAAEEEYLDRAPLEELLTDRAVYQAFQRLPRQQRLVLTLLLLRGAKQQAVARRLQISQQAVCKSKQQALRRLRATARARGGSR